MSFQPCIEDCGFLAELGPPPDLILNLPPPPVPSFLQTTADLFLATNGSCNFCSIWAKGVEVPYVEVKRKGQSNDDTTYFIAISACIGVIIMSILVIIAIIRCKESKIKPVPDPYGKRAHSTNIQPSIGDTTLYANSSADGVIPTCAQPKVLWSGLGTAETSPYTLQHQPVSRDDPASFAHYEYIDYGSVGHTYAYPTEVVRIMNDGENHYCYPDSLDVSFENCGYVNSENNHATSL